METKDYSLFVQRSTVDSVQRVNKALEESLCTKGWLSSLPLSAYRREDGRLEILDGQNRFKIAMTFALPIQYVVKDESHDIATCG